MNIFTLLMLLFTLIGLVDYLLGGKFGLVKEFDQGLKTMGPTLFSMMGFYCISISLLNKYGEGISQFFFKLHLQPEVVFGMLLAPDLGGYAIANKLASSANVAIMTSVLLTSTIGATISFQFPVFLGSIDHNDVPSFIKGIIYGVMVLPFLLIFIALYLKISIDILFPFFLLCGLLIVGMIFFSDITLNIVIIFGKIIQKLSIILFIVVLFTIYFNIPFTDLNTIKDIIYTGFLMCITVCGAMVLCALLQKFLHSFLIKIANKLKVNEYAMIGLLLSLGSSVAMIPLFNKMDKKGKILNAAFSVSGAYVFGGQYAFISSYVSKEVCYLYIVTKFIAGILALFIANILTNRMEN